MFYLQDAWRFGAFFFILIGIYCSYTDIKERRIKNWLLAGGVFGGFCLYIFSYPKPIDRTNFFLSIVIATILAFFLWRINIWAAGDAKFFIFTSVFVYQLSPLSILQNTSLNLPIILVVFVNAFILALLYIFLQTLIAFLRRLFFILAHKDLRKVFNNLLRRVSQREFIFLHLKIFFFYIATLILVSVFLKRIFRIINLEPRYYFLLYIFLLFTYRQVRRILIKIKLAYLVILLFLVVVLFRVDMFSIARTAFRFFIFLGVLRSCINWYINKEQTRVIVPDGLRSNMILAAEEIADLPSEEQPKLRFLADGLTPEQAKDLSAYFKRKDRKGIKIYNTFPFVPFIVISLIITYFLRGKLLNILFFLY